MGRYFRTPARLGRCWTIVLAALALLGLASCGSGSRLSGLAADEQAGLAVPLLFGPESSGLPSEVDRQFGLGGLRGVSALSWGSPVTVDNRAWGLNIDQQAMAVINGNPAIAFAFATKVKGGQTWPVSIAYIRATDAGGNAWGRVKVAVPGDPKKYTPSQVYTAESLALVNGNPAISYYAPQSQDLCFVRATDASGNAWGAPLTVDSAGDVGSSSSLAIIDGKPAIAYRDTTNRVIKYVYSANANGSAWGSPQVLETGGYFSWPNLVQVNGNPAVCFTQHGTAADSTEFELHYIRASDQTGAAWGSPVTIISDSTPGETYPVYWQTSMVIVDGNPAICFTKRLALNGPDTVCFVRAVDVDGSAWGAAATLDDGGSAGFASNGSMAVVNGLPTVSYLRMDSWPGGGYLLSLNSVQATAADGSAWEAPQFVTGGGLRSSLVALPGGEVAVAFESGNEAMGMSVKYVRGQ